MSKKSLILITAVIFLAASVFYSYSAKKSFYQEKNKVELESKEIKHIIELKRVWKAKGVKSKVEKILKRYSNKKINFKRQSFNLSVQNLSYKDFNNLLNKLSSMPLQFKELNIKKVGNNFNLECLCEW